MPSDKVREIAYTKVVKIHITQKNILRTSVFCMALVVFNLFPSGKLLQNTKPKQILLPTQELTSEEYADEKNFYLKIVKTQNPKIALFESMAIPCSVKASGV